MDGTSAPSAAADDGMMRLRKYSSWGLILFRGWCGSGGGGMGWNEIWMDQLAGIVND